MVRNGRSRRNWPLLAPAAALLTSCTQTLPAPEAGAFRAMAAANRDAFGALVQREEDAQLAAVARGLYYNSVRIKVDGCDPGQDVDCTLTYSVADVDSRIEPAAPEARKLIGAVARYGERMAELAEAKDLDTIRTKAEGAGGAVKSLLGVVGLPPPATLIVDLVVFAGNASRIEKRRRALLDAAEGAQPGIERVVTMLTAMTPALTGNVLAQQAQEVLVAQVEVDSGGRTYDRLVARRNAAKGDRARAQLDRNIADLRTDRIAAFGRLREAQLRYNAMRQPPPDYARLTKAHLALIAKLQRREVDMENVIADIDFFVSLADEAGLSKE